MKIELDIPDGVDFHGLFYRGDGWGAILACTKDFWPTQYGTFHTCSAASYGCSSKELAITVAFNKIKIAMSQIDGYIRTPPPRAEPKLNSAVLAGVNLGDLDL
jgi:hypothetical protein